MLWSTRELKRFSLRARDGEIGDVTDLYFSDDRWIVRYFVVASGGWLEGHQFLVSPLAIDIPLNPAAKVIPVRLTQEQLRNAPAADTEQPVSRHYETRYYDYFRWPYYWVGGAGWGSFVAAGDLARAAVKGLEQIDAPDEPNLRSTGEVEGYRFEGNDGSVGHVEGFLVSDETWSIRYVEIDTRNWWPGGKSVLLATEWVREVDWAERRLRADVLRRTVKAAPKYDDSAPITEDYEEALAQHYRLARSAVAFR